MGRNPPLYISLLREKSMSYRVLKLVTFYAGLHFDYILIKKYYLDVKKSDFLSKRKNLKKSKKKFMVYKTHFFNP